MEAVCNLSPFRDRTSEITCWTVSQFDLSEARSPIVSLPRSHLLLSISEIMLQGGGGLA